MTTALATLETVHVGDEASCEFVATEERIRAFADFSLDTNPLHLDPQSARDLGFPQRVAHGMIALTAVSRLIGTQLPGPGSLWVSQEVRFVAPVLLDDPVTVRVVVERVSQATGIVQLKTEANHTIRGSLLLSGTARVRVLGRNGAA
jgi:acyl dehydratase